MTSTRWKPGDRAIYRMQKRSTAPGPRAQDVYPAASGDTYTYLVDKYWVVAEVLDDGQLLLRTRRGKQHTVAGDGPRLRRPNWWERWFLASRFPNASTTAGS